MGRPEEAAAALPSPTMDRPEGAAAEAPAPATVRPEEAEVVAILQMNTKTEGPTLRSNDTAGRNASKT